MWEIPKVLNGTNKPGVHRIVYVVLRCGQPIAGNSSDSYVVRFPYNRLYRKMREGTGSYNTRRHNLMKIKCIVGYLVYIFSVLIFKTSSLIGDWFKANRN